MLQDSGNRIQEAGFILQDSGNRIQEAGFIIQDSASKIQTAGFRHHDCKLQDSGSRIVSYRIQAAGL